MEGKFVYSLAPFSDGAPGRWRSGAEDFVEFLLEREAALAELAALAAKARRGSGRVVLLRGEAGVGKTAVIARFAAGLDNARILRGWCDPLIAPRPLASRNAALSAPRDLAMRSG